MKIVTADITGSLIVNGVNVTDNVVSSSVFSGSIAGRVTNLEQFSASLDATFATDASVTASILVLSQSVQASQAALSSSYTATSASYLATSASYVVVSGSYAAASASLSIRTTDLEATASINTQASASFAAYSASVSTRLTTDETNITTLTNASASFANQSASLSTRLTTDETNITTLTNASASFAAQSASLSTRLTTDETNFNTTSGSIAGRVTLIEGQYATTGSNTFTKPQQITDVSNAISFTSTASLYTDGGLRVKGAAYISGTAYFNDVVVYGTSSIEYITSSQLAIGTNIITLNTDTPSIRYGGISVYDSGSNNLSTGSLFWDSEKDKWIYSNPSGSTYDGGMLISGPRNTSGLGNEVGTTSCALMMGQGGDHITSSAIFSYGNATCFYGNSYISGSGLAYFASTVCASNGSFTGCMGIGKSPDFKLDVGGQADGVAETVARIGNVSGVNNGLVISKDTSNNYCYHFANGNSCFGGTNVIAGCLGIGTTPTQRLTVAGNVLLSGASTNLNFSTPSSGNGDISFDGNAFAVVSNSSSACLLLSTNSTSRLQITSTGIACFACQVCAPQVIASTSLTATTAFVQPNVLSGLSGLYLQNNNTGGYGVSLGLGLYGYTTSAYFNTLRIESSYPAYGRTLFFTKAQSNSTEVLALNWDGTGVACFACQLCAASLIANGIVDINGNSAITSISDKFALGVNSTCYTWIQSYGGRSIYINALGNNVLLPNNTTRLGIGTCTPSAKLHIDAGSISSDTNVIHLSSTDSSGTNKWGMVWYSGNGADFRGKVMADNNGKLYLDSVGGGGVILNGNGGSGNIGIGSTSPSYQLDMCSGTTVNQRIRLQRGSDDTNQNMLLGWNNIVVTRHNVSISTNQTDFSLIQCGSDGARVPFYIGVGGHACFTCPASIATGCRAFGRGLTVASDIVAYFSADESITMGISAGTGAQSWGIQVCDTGDGSNTLHLNARGGFVGINKGAGNVAAYPLDVTGVIRSTSNIIASGNVATTCLSIGAIAHYQNYSNTTGCFAVFCASQGAILYVTSMHNGGRATYQLLYSNGATGGASISVIGQTSAYGPACTAFALCGNGWVYAYQPYGGPTDYYAIGMNSNFAWGF